ncbi:MAG: energy transducer TonB [Bradyrhizobium sp.]|uniref:energy transducer TonB family protein n=1 Tax=Bradyrhizobium sp. TaxID=376 RepID=UPI001D6724FA|nr:energy transducer TonB [Bradyrhizobium sp.]MBV9560209.1 energy transducer TonB [Bradyrhizobium sp.]
MADFVRWLTAGCLVSLLGLLPGIASPSLAGSDAVGAWQQQIALHLGSQKRFPPNARGQSGTAKVRFTIDRTGRLVSAQLLESTGHPQLDAEAIALLHRAQPFPAPPLEVNGDALKFDLPIVFTAPPVESRDSDAVIKGEEMVNAKMRGICRGC